MVDGLTVAPGEIEPLLVSLDVPSRVHLERSVAIHRWLLDNGASNAHAAHKGLLIGWQGQKVRANGRRCSRVGRLDVNCTPRFGPQLRDAYRHAGLPVECAGGGVAVAGVHEEILHIRRAEFRPRLDEAMR